MCQVCFVEPVAGFHVSTLATGLCTSVELLHVFPSVEEITSVTERYRHFRGGGVLRISFALVLCYSQLLMCYENFVSFIQNIKPKSLKDRITCKY